ncbi:NAD(P)/FAD-dependent oxidoreductase [Siccirubricoccus deserti]
MDQQKPRIVVVGAGIVGLCTAWHLARGGAEVMVLDGAAPGSGASSGNAGAISGGSVAPLAMPGVLKQVPQMLLDPAGALHIPPRYWPRAAPWLLRFVASARPARVAAIADALAALMFGAMEQHRAILAEEGALDLIRETGQLYLYRDRAHYAKDAGGWALRQQHGMRVEYLDGAEAIRALEPDMRGDYRLGLFIPDQGSSVNPLRQAQVVARGVERQGGIIRREKVTALTTEGGRVTGVATAAGAVAADQVVLAAGAWSARLLAPLGIRVPLESQRGYHVMLPDAGISLQRPVVPADRKAFVSPMEEACALPARWSSAGSIIRRRRSGRRCCWRICGTPSPGPHRGRRGFWMGHRPCLPDSLPVLGPVRRWPGLWCAFGHGHLGLTGSAPTGAALARAMLGPAPNLDLAPFAVERFG